MRWTEQLYVFRGKNPIDIWERSDAIRHGRLPPTSTRDTTFEPDLGVPDGGYPPWAYATGALFTWPKHLTAARILYGCVNLMSLALILRFAYRLGRSSTHELGVLLCAAVFAVASICTTFGLGQYGMLVLTTLFAALVLVYNGRWFGAGVLMGVGLTKITLSAPFLLPLVLKKHFGTTAVALACITIGSLMVWPSTHTDPVSMLAQLFHSAGHFAEKDYSLSVLFTTSKRCLVE